MRSDDAMAFWQDFRREQALARHAGRPFRMTLSDYAELRLKEQRVREQGRRLRRAALNNLFVRGTGQGFGQRLKAGVQVLDQTLRADMRAGDELRRSVARGISPAAVPVTPAVPDVVEDVDPEIGRFEMQHTDLLQRTRRGVVADRKFHDYCGARTSKDTRCRKVRPCPYHGRR